MVLIMCLILRVHRKIIFMSLNWRIARDLDELFRRLYVNVSELKTMNYYKEMGMNHIVSLQKMMNILCHFTKKKGI